MKTSTLVRLSAALTLALALSSSGDSFTDPRDKQVYRTVKIGKQVWMAKNLNYRTDSSFCYDLDGSNCKIYGRLYHWKKAKDACPSGWHLPSNAEWDSLAVAANGVKSTPKYIELGNGEKFRSEYDPDYYSGAGKSLKSKMGWADDYGAWYEKRGPRNGNGTDDFGFSAMPGGSHIDDATLSSGATLSGNWWSATKYERKETAYTRQMGHSNDDLTEMWGDMRHAISVRCVRD